AIALSRPSWIEGRSMSMNGIDTMTVGWPSPAAIAPDLEALADHHLGRAARRDLKPRHRTRGEGERELIVEGGRGVGTVHNGYRGGPGRHGLGAKATNPR